MRTHRRTLPIALALVLALALGACAPSALGDRTNPYVVGRDGPAAVRAGGSVFVEVSVAPSVFAYTQADLGTRLAPWGQDRLRGVITPLLELRDVIAPDGWDVTLDRAVAYIAPRRPEADVEAILRITAPADARAGGYRVRVDLVDQRGRRAPLEIVVQVGM